MRTIIYVPTVDTPVARRAIVRGDLALHLSVRIDERLLNEWSITHVGTGRQIIVMQGCCAGRVAFRMLSSLSFATIDRKLMSKCNTVVKRLRKRGLTVLFPRSQFVMHD